MMFVSDYITKNGANQETTTYMQQYCTQKYPTGGLSIFGELINTDPKDYQQFELTFKNQFPSLNLGSIRPNCLLPACINSPFKNNELDNCPIPQRLEIVNIDNSDITGKVIINQNVNCSKYGIVPNRVPTDSLNLFWSDYKWLIIIASVMIFIIIILVIIFPIDNKNKKIITIVK